VPAYDFILPDHPLSRALRGLLHSFPDENVRILNTTDDQKKAIVLVYSDRDPGRYMLVDVDKLSAEEIVAKRPWVNPSNAAEMTAFHMRARDGAWIHGYVTMPKTSRTDELPPLVVLPHGGPHGVRDVWAYDDEVQLLASEGFAVLQVNYRGSGGYGRAYQTAGYRHWGDRIVQDIVDATRFAVDKRYADPRRVCIIGGSFGGYAAMQSAIVAPDLFRCAVGVAGVYDLGLMAHEGDIPETPLGRAFVRTAVGEDSTALKEASPVQNADKLRARVLLIHGKKDQRAPIEHAERLKSALEEKGRPPEWLVEPKEGHGFYDEDARERMYSRLLQFLRENTRAAAPSSASSDPGSRPNPAPLQPVPAAAPGR
jgi:dipeptidyl aminopeptidase/acylaminoacyl peptidase